LRVYRPDLEEWVWVDDVIFDDATLESSIDDGVEF